MKTPPFVYKDCMAMGRGYRLPWYRDPAKAMPAHPLHPRYIQGGAWAESHAPWCNYALGSHTVQLWVRAVALSVAKNNRARGCDLRCVALGPCAHHRLRLCSGLRDRVLSGDVGDGLPSMRSIECGPVSCQLSVSRLSQCSQSAPGTDYCTLYTVATEPRAR